jgi:hypothetical protein
MDGRRWCGTRRNSSDRDSTEIPAALAASPSWLKAAASDLRAAHNAAVVLDAASVEPRSPPSSAAMGEDSLN